MIWPILNKDHDAALTELYKEHQSDRVVAIIGGAMLDDSLRLAIKYRLRLPVVNETDITDKLLKIGGPLGNTEPKIHLAYSLYIVEKDERNAMYGINEIRNLFAHRLGMSFSDDDKKLKTALAKLSVHVGKTHYTTPVGKEPIESINGPKDQFIVNLKFCLDTLMTDHGKHLPGSNVHLA
jgi:hypothetical protein